MSIDSKFKSLLKSDGDILAVLQHASIDLVNQKQNTYTRQNEGIVLTCFNQYYATVQIHLKFKMTKLNDLLLFNRPIFSFASFSTILIVSLDTNRQSLNLMKVAGSFTLVNISAI